MLSSYITILWKVLSSYITNQSFTGPIKCSSPSQPWPIGRTFATLTPLIEPEMVGQRLCGCGPILRQKVLLLWGKNLDRIICDEAWILDVETQTWIQVSPLNLNLAIISWCVEHSKMLESRKNLHYIFCNAHVEAGFINLLHTWGWSWTLFPPCITSTLTDEHRQEPSFQEWVGFHWRLILTLAYLNNPSTHTHSKFFHRRLKEILTHLSEFP